MGKAKGCELRFRVEEIGGWDVPIVEFVESARSVSTLVNGTIGNSAADSVTGKKTTLDWKRNVLTEIKALRGSVPWNPALRYSVSLGMRFSLKNHRNQKLDADNFIKPVLDAVAAGLFCPDDTDPSTNERWNFNDSNFRTLFIHRFEDVRDPAVEGVAIHVSAI